MAVAADDFDGLPQDDECNEAGCGLNALQLRSAMEPSNETLAVNKSVNGTKKKKSGCTTLAYVPPCCSDYSLSRSTRDFDYAWDNYKACRRSSAGCRAKFSKLGQSGRFLVRCIGGCESKGDCDTHRRRRNLFDTISDNIANIPVPNIPNPFR